MTVAIAVAAMVNMAAATSFLINMCCEYFDRPKLGWSGLSEVRSPVVRSWARPPPGTGLIILSESRTGRGSHSPAAVGFRAAIT